MKIHTAWKGNGNRNSITGVQWEGMGIQKPFPQTSTRNISDFRILQQSCLYSNVVILRLLPYCH